MSEVCDDCEALTDSETDGGHRSGTDRGAVQLHEEQSHAIDRKDVGTEGPGIVQTEDDVTGVEEEEGGP